MENNKEKIEKKQSMDARDFLADHFKMATAAVIILIFAASYFFLIMPKYDEIKNLTDALDEKTGEIAAMQERLADMNRAKDDYKDIDDANIRKLDAILPDGKNNGDVLLPLFENMVSRNGLLMTSIQINDIAPSADEGGNALASGIGKVKVAMEVIGTDYSNFKRLLETIENNLRITDITKVSFSPDGNKTSIEAVAYYQK